MNRPCLLWIGLGVIFLWIVGCTPVPVEEGDEQMVRIDLTSPAFESQGMIPEQYTCDGRDISPELNWTVVPSGTRSFALIVDDPDAPAGTWVHWVLFDIPAEVRSLPAGVRGVGVEGRNGWRSTGYGGPCPPPGEPHRYFFKLYALDGMLELPSGASKAEVERAMQGRILGQGELVGLYGR